MTPARRPARIAAFAGRFASQPLVFAHLVDAAPGLDPGEVEVCQGTGLRARLGAYFDPDTVTALLVALDEDDTVVLTLPEAGTFSGSELLRPLGRFDGSLLRAR